MDYNLYIHSKNRNNQDTPYDFTLMLPNQIIANAQEYVKVSVMSFYMMNTMYNISSILKNNTFEVETRDSNNQNPSTTLYTIPDGNYSVLTLRDFLNTELSGKISISYNYHNNTYTFIKTNSNNRYYIKNINCPKSLGLSTDTEITLQGINSTFINMVEYQQIIIKSDLSYRDLCQDNISRVQDDLFNISQVLFWTSKQDVEPFKNISYNNCDAGDSFTYNIIDDNINSINFKVFNENNQLITDCPDWFLHLRFTIVKKETDTYINLFNKGLKALNDIKYVLLNIFFAIIRNGTKKNLCYY